jgi:mannose-6-phosphate isomerase-like protein (cupin superfamily)
METTTQTAPFTVAADAGETLAWGPHGGTVRVLADAARTGGGFGIVESIDPPGAGAPLHVHHGEAEAFYVLEGEVEVTCGDTVERLSAGAFAYGPAGVAHKFANVGDGPLRMLLVFSRPGFEQFFRDGSAVGPDGMPEVLARYDLELLEGFGH